MQGLFLSFDGLDGCGKTTQIQLLSEWLKQQGREVTVTREPGGTPLGEQLRDILLHRQEIPLDMNAEMLLYMASRAQLVADVIRPALARGHVVIADRYLLANVVYQGTAGGLPEATLWDVGRIATGGLMPRLTLLLDISPANAQSRLTGKLDRLESRGLEYMQRVRDGFLQQRSHLGARSEVLDACQSVQAIHEQVVALVTPELGTGGS